MRDGGGGIRRRRHPGGGGRSADRACWCITTRAIRRSSRRDLADAVNALVAEPEKARQYGQAGRQRCIEEFSWAHIAEQTLEIYRKVAL